MKSRSVRIWAIKTNTGAKTKRKSYTVRWLVAGQEKSATFVTRALADNFRSDLKQAVNAGEEFDVNSGLPASMQPVEVGDTWLEFAARYVAMKWPAAAAKSRVSMIDALITVTPALVASRPGRPDALLLRHALQAHLVPGGEVGPEHVEALRWLQAASVPLTSLTDAEIVRGGLDALSRLLTGAAAQATTRQRKRAVFYNVLEYAVELKRLPYNPIDQLRVRSGVAKAVKVVDRRVVASSVQARELLTALTYVGERDKDRGRRLRAFFACIYFAALRPSEALALRVQDCQLPTSGWGRLEVERNRPQAGKQWTDSGNVHDDRGLKRRAEHETRRVPIPPELVAILSEHVEQYGTGKDGRLFSSTRGGVVAAGTYSRVWKQARLLALHPVKVASPLAARPYDLRHSALSLWLNAGVPAPEVAERAGHSVEVLLKVYAKCIDGEEEAVNRRIELALRPE